MEATMPKFTRFERPAGDEINVPGIAPLRPGDELLIIDRVLVDRKGNQRGTFVLRGTIVQVFPDGDAVMSFEASNKFKKGVLNTQGVVRFSEFDTGVTFCHCRRDRQVQEGSRHGESEIPEVQLQDLVGRSSTEPACSQL